MSSVQILTKYSQIQTSFLQDTFSLKSTDNMQSKQCHYITYSIKLKCSRTPPVSVRLTNQQQSANCNGSITRYVETRSKCSGSFYSHLTSFF